MSAKKQAGLARFGFGPLSTVRNPLVHPLPVFGPKARKLVKRGPGRLWRPANPQQDLLLQQRLRIEKRRQEKEAAARLKHDKRLFQWCSSRLMVVVVLDM